MAANKLKELGLEELQKKRTQTKNVLTFGIGAWIAILVILLIIGYLNAKADGEVKISEIFSETGFPFGAGLGFFLLLYMTFRGYDKELENREQ